MRVKNLNLHLMPLNIPPRRGHESPYNISILIICQTTINNGREVYKEVVLNGSQANVR